MLKRRWAKIPIFLLCLAPVLWLAWRAWQQDLTPNPIEYITHFTGDWTIRLIVITLTVTPLRKLLRLPDLIRFRRMIGLFAFFYACLHFLTYFWLDKFFDFHEISQDVVKRPFITAGFTAFVLMLPLACTSTAGWIRRLGGKRWQRIHRLIYFTAIVAVIHYYWLVKSDTRRPVFYGSLVAIVLAYRMVVWSRARLWPPPARRRAQAAVS
ncbi:MAG: protein-methionine-sulfoxide reductase heme-binding subunit MsrQ [Bryobacteraceae bacterium]|jgi:sulfoxide reductase heme-binding subunit YedZ